jgi:tetratricopeptide (TPR) repeat protein
MDISEFIKTVATTPVTIVLFASGLLLILLGILGVDAKVGNASIRFGSRRTILAVLTGLVLLLASVITSLIQHSQVNLVRFVQEQTDQQVDLLYQRGTVLIDLGQYQSAIAAFDQLLKLRPHYAPAWEQRSVALSELGKFDEALKSNQEALAINPNYSKAWYHRGKLFLRSTNTSASGFTLSSETAQALERSVYCFDRAIQTNRDWQETNPADAWYHRGFALEKLNQKQEALASYDRALKLKPDHRNASANRSLLQKKLKAS